MTGQEFSTKGLTDMTITESQKLLDGVSERCVGQIGRHITMYVISLVHAILCESMEIVVCFVTYCIILCASL